MENQTPEVVVSQRPKSNPILWVVIGSAILASGIGIGLVAGKYFQPVSSTTSVSIVPSTPILSPTVVPVEEDDPTATWKTYTSEKFGFSFRYPETWKDISDPKSATEFKIETTSNEVVLGTIFDGKADKAKDKSWIRNLDLINNKSILISYMQCAGMGCKEGSKDIAIFDQILSTFKFVFLGYDLQRRTDVNAVIRPGLELYKFDHKQYPDSLNLLVPAYLITLPVDPVTKESYPYKVSVNKSDYNITVAMEDGTVLVVESPK